MKKIILLFIFLLLSFSAYSQRVFSNNNIKIGILKRYNNPNIYIIERRVFYKIKFNKILNYKISPVCIIRNELNGFIVINELKNNINKPIVYKMENKKVKYIWILTNKEYKVLIGNRL